MKLKMNCPFGKNEKTPLRKKLTKLGYKIFYCGKCDLTYNERTATPFNYLSIPTDVLFLILLYRLRYKLSLRDVARFSSSEDLSSPTKLSATGKNALPTF